MRSLVVQAWWSIRTLLCLANDRNDSRDHAASAYCVFCRYHVFESYRCVIELTLEVLRQCAKGSCQFTGNQVGTGVAVAMSTVLATMSEIAILNGRKVCISAAEF